LRGLIPQEDQRRFAEIYVSAFLEVVTRDNREYLPIFRDHRVIGQWLPNTMYITRMETNADRVLATFEEDIDVTTGTEAGIVLRGDSLATWAEENLKLRSSNRSGTSASQDNQAVRLGWNNRISGPDTTRMGPPAAYVLELGNRVAARWALGRGHSINFQLGPTNGMPGPRKDPTLATTEPSDDDRGSRGGGSRGGEEDDEKPPVDLSVELEDAAGRTAKVTLSEYGAIRRPLETYVMRRGDQEAQRFADNWDLILQSFAIPLTDFMDANADLDVRQLTAVRFVFDKATAGEVVIDQIAFAELDPAFWSARVER
ncbi:MAG: hypothetical protein HN645_08215, partial [Gemmatimonadales bacterium]|nr:hypothetical protein [Gemmatimonadales bacterium]